MCTQFGNLGIFGMYFFFGDKYSEYFIINTMSTPEQPCYYDSNFPDYLRRCFECTQYTMWLPIFILQIFEISQMIRLIGTRDVQKIVYGGPQVIEEDENYLLNLKEEELRKSALTREENIAKESIVKFRLILFNSICTFWFFVIEAISYLGQENSIEIPNSIMILSWAAKCLIYFLIFIFMNYYSFKLYYLMKKNLFFHIVYRPRMIFYFLMVNAYCVQLFYVVYEGMRQEILFTNPIITYEKMRNGYHEWWLEEPSQYTFIAYMTFAVLNPINIILKTLMIQFEDFQKVTIELHYAINAYDGKINLYWKKGQENKKQIKFYKWITCETETDLSDLNDRFIATDEEKRLHGELNAKALNESIR